MSQSTYQTVVLAARPKASIIPNETFSIKSNPIVTEADLQDGQILVETLYLSLDPAMRDTRSYMPPVQIGEKMRGAAICKVLASKSASYSVGGYIQSNAGWILLFLGVSRGLEKLKNLEILNFYPSNTDSGNNLQTELAIVDANDPTTKPLTIPEGGKLTDTLGALGPTGLTAYFGMLDIGQVKAGDFVVVSGAAGATGSVACQIAKLKGAKVLGIAGSDDKVAWLKEFCDDALNYKAADFAKQFKAKTPDLIDVFYDNVGGEVLELALSRAKMFARFVMCG
ncbi:putative NADP-dependent oxidoreductase, partial [Lachnellula willkommii]